MEASLPLICRSSRNSTSIQVRKVTAGCMSTVSHLLHGFLRIEFHERRNERVNGSHKMESCSVDKNMRK